MERSNKKRSSRKADSTRRRRARDASAEHQAQRHNKVRRDHSVEIKEDYVELIAQLLRTHGEARTVDLAERLGVSHVTVTKTISRLQQAGLVRAEPYRSIFLTDLGRELARASEVRHQLIVAFLCKLGVEPSVAETDAEGIEHHVSGQTLEAFRRFTEEAP